MIHCINQLTLAGIIMKRKILSATIFLLTSSAYGLNGTVTDSAGKPIKGAAIEVVGGGVQAVTGADGRFEFERESIDEIHIKARGYSHRVLHLHGDYAEPLEITLYPTIMEQIDVVGLPLHASTMESAQPIAVVGGDELRSKQASTLGETLKGEVGVHSTYFGPVASSPIIRGLDGPRVMITQNGFDAADASRVGPDHVVATETVTAQQIEILRGPATLFYGSGAIGGVINIVDDRVPADSEVRSAFLLAHDTVASEDEAAASFTGGSDLFAVHVDGFWRESDDYKIPGIAFLESEEEHEEEGHEEHSEGVLENSAGRSHGVNIGGSVLLDRGFVGLSYGRLDRINGLPGHGHEEEAEEEIEGEEHAEEKILSELEQDRWQLISDLQIDSPLLSAVKIRLGYTDYIHREIHAEEAEELEPVADHEEADTVFKNETLQARLELLHQEFAGWRGAVSLEGKATDFEAAGEEAFTAPSKTKVQSIALMEERHSGNILWQLGARVERVNIEVDPIEFEHHHEVEGTETDSAELLMFDDLTLTPYSLSAGLVWDFTPDYKWSVAYSHAQRAPSAAELYSVGPHIGTGAYEIGALFNLHEEDGEVHLDYHGHASEEVSNNLDLSLRKHHGDFGFIINVFYNRIADFYYERDTGLHYDDVFGHAEEEEEGHEGHNDALPIYIFEQADATFYGLEVESAWQLTASLKLTAWADTIRGKLDDGGELPRIPPVRLGGGFNYQKQDWQFDFDAVHYFDQNKIALNETPTDGYTLLDATLQYRLPLWDSDLVIFAKAENITDEEARVHSSYLKEVAPLPGRGFTIGLRGEF